MLAHLTLPIFKGGYRRLAVEVGPREEEYHYIPEPERLHKVSGRCASIQTHVRGLVQLWLFNPLAQTLDYQNRRTLLLRQHSEDALAFEQRLWKTVQLLCPVPLLASWEGVIDTFKGYGWIRYHYGFNVDAVKIDFSAEDVEKRISWLIQCGQLTLPGKPH